MLHGIWGIKLKQSLPRAETWAGCAWTQRAESRPWRRPRTATTALSVAAGRNQWEEIYITSLSVCPVAEPTWEAKPELLLFVLWEMLVPCYFYSWHSHWKFKCWFSLIKGQKWKKWEWTIHGARQVVMMDRVKVHGPCHVLRNIPRQVKKGPEN